MSEKQTICWLELPEEHDYPAALSYLSLLFDVETATEFSKELSAAPVSKFKAKDIFRASGLSLLGVSNFHVEKNRNKIVNGIAISPLLLVREQGKRVIVADGYHRLCAVYSFNEDAWIPCKLV